MEKTTGSDAFKNAPTIWIRVGKTFEAKASGVLGVMALMALIAGLVALTLTW